MKAVMIEKPWEIKNVEREIPEIKDGEALIKVKQQESAAQTSEHSEVQTTSFPIQESLVMR